MYFDRFAFVTEMLFGPTAF